MLKDRARAALDQHGKKTAITGFATMSVLAIASATCHSLKHHNAGETLGQLMGITFILSSILAYLTLEFGQPERSTAHNDDEIPIGVDRDGQIVTAKLWSDDEPRRRPSPRPREIPGKTILLPKG